MDPVQNKAMKSKATMAPLLEATLNHAIQYLDDLDKTPVAHTASLQELVTRFKEPLPTKGTDSITVIDQLVANTRDGLIGSSSGKFFAWVIGGEIPASLAADWLTSTWDQNAALYGHSPVGAVVEEVAGEWMKSLFHLPAECSFAFTTGCQQAHFTCLSSARFAQLERVGWDVNEEGLFGAPRVHVITTDQRHRSVDRAIRYLGMGNKAITSCKTKEDGCVDIDVFRSILEGITTAEDGSKKVAPIIIVLNAADLHVGAIDEFAILAPIAHEYGAWVHVDGAFGLFACASRKTEHLVKGIQMCDSWATDGHKWLNVPYDCGFAFVKNSDAHKKSMTISCDYCLPEKEARDQIDYNPEWSRRARGFNVYACLKELGREGVENMVDRCCGHCLRLVEGIGALPQAEILWRPTLNQGLLRFIDPAVDQTSADAIKMNDAFTEQVIDEINATGGAFFSSSRWRNLTVMRVSVVNWRTSDEDVENVIQKVTDALSARLASTSE